MGYCTLYNGEIRQYSLYEDNGKIKTDAISKEETIHINTHRPMGLLALPRGNMVFVADNFLFLSFGRA